MTGYSIYTTGYSMYTTGLSIAEWSGEGGTPFVCCQQCTITVLLLIFISNIYVFFCVSGGMNVSPKREDVADVLVRCLGTAEATGKTFEVQSLPGLDKVWMMF